MRKKQVIKIIKINEANLENLKSQFNDKNDEGRVYRNVCLLQSELLSHILYCIDNIKNKKELTKYRVNTEKLTIKDVFGVPLE